MQLLSLRKYAALVGISHTAVAKAIKAGYISNGWDPELKKIRVEEANEEWGNEIKTRKQKADPGSALGDTGGKIFAEPLSPNIAFSEARRYKEIYSAEIARITALKEQGVYVEKEKVYAQLFEFGKHLRLSLMSIPDRVIDNILAARNRTEAHGILLNAIVEVLEGLTHQPELGGHP